jgi:hypothetical protein
MLYKTETRPTARLNGKICVFQYSRLFLIMGSLFTVDYVDVLRPSRVVNPPHTKYQVLEVFLERLVDRGEEEACSTPHTERLGFCGLLHGDASSVCPPPCDSPICSCGISAVPLALVAYYLLAKGRRADAEALASAVERAAREDGKPCLAQCFRDVLEGREPTCGSWPASFEELYCLALAALVNPIKRSEALVAVEHAIKKAVEPIPAEIMKGYEIIDNEPTDIGLYFLYKILTTNQRGS